jgi:hypothetical protein
MYINYFLNLPSLSAVVELLFFSSSSVMLIGAGVVEVIVVVLEIGLLLGLRLTLGEVSGVGVVERSVVVGLLVFRGVVLLTSNRVSSLFWKVISWCLGNSGAFVGDSSSHFE